MSSVAEIEESIAALSPGAFEALTGWIEDRREQRTDAAFTKAIAAGKFDGMAARALRDIEFGKAVSLDEVVHRP